MSGFLSSVKPKSAYWHFNTTLTLDKEFRDVFKAFWDGFLNTRHLLSLYNSGGILAKCNSNSCVNSILEISQATEPGKLKF